MRAFVRVVDTGSFSRAADQLALPRSTVSKLVGDLETHLGVRLMHRTTRSMAPTAEGVEYHAHAQRLIDDIDVVEQALRGKRKKPRGHLRIDAPASFATSLLIPALPDFHRVYPDITISLGVSDRPVNLVGDGVDCVIRAGAIDDGAMVGRALPGLAYVTCAAPAYLARMGTPTHPDQLQHHLKAGYFFAASTRPNPLLFERNGERLLIESSDFASNDGNGLLAMLRAGMGIGQHFRRVVQPCVDAGELVTVLDDWTRPPMPFHLLYPPGRHQNARLKAFVDWMMASFRD
jgi:DNA-binding transcriptional LysR family regulator